MQSIYDTRRVNLRSLIGQWGGPTSLAKKLGHANGSYIAQLAGPRPSRDVSERTAREIESRLRLPVGWMDQDHPSGGTHLNDEALADVVRAVATEIRDVDLRLTPSQYATIVQLVYDNAKTFNRIDPIFIGKLIGLARGGAT